jgi:hypothetical protein
MNTAGTFISPTGERKAFKFGTQPKGWTLETQAPNKMPADTMGMDYLLAMQKQLGSGPAAQKYAEASKDYQSGLANQSAFANALKLALQGADVETADLKKQRRSLMEQAFNAPTQMREQLMTQGVTDPFARQRLINERYNAQMGGAGNLQDVIGQKGGELQDILNTGTGAYESNLNAQNIGLKDLAGQRDLEQNVLTNWYNQQYKPKSTQEWADIEKELGLKSKYDTSGGGGGLTDLQQITLEQKGLDKQGVFNNAANRISNGENPQDVIDEVVKGGDADLVDDLNTVAKEYIEKRKSEGYDPSRGVLRNTWGWLNPFGG